MSLRRLGLLHTSATLVPMFEQLCKAKLENVSVFNLVDDSLIKDVIEHGHLRPVENPTLFDEEELVEFEDLDEPELPNFEAQEFLSPERREALKSLAAQLLELREMLKTDQTREAERHLLGR